MNLIHLSEAWRIFKRSRYVRRNGVKKYKGSAEEICKQIVKDCWNGKYFQVSTGHFCEFYIRDFGWCVDSLLKLGYRKEVLKTLEYIMEIYSQQGLKTTITPSGKAVDIFRYSPDSLAYLIRSLRAAGAHNLILKYKNFLIKEVNRFHKIVIDNKTGLVRKNKSFGSMKDQSKRRSSCYDNIMAAMLSLELDKLKLDNPLRTYAFEKTIKDKFWTGSYFLDDLNGGQAVTGDSNIFPFWTGIFSEKKMLKRAIASIEAGGLDNPFPLKYSNYEVKQNMIFVERFVPNYEKDTCWMHMGPLYVQLVKKVDKKKAREYKKKYKELIERNHNFLELFNPDGTPFRSAFYYADEGMLWAANYLTL